MTKGDWRHIGTWIGNLLTKSRTMGCFLMFIKKRQMKTSRVAYKKTSMLRRQLRPMMKKKPLEEPVEKYNTPYGQITFDNIAHAAYMKMKAKWKTPV